MGRWLLSVVCVILLSTIFNILLPNGKLSKNIKNVFGLIVILVVLQPLFGLDFNEIKQVSLENDTEIVFQENYLNYISNQKLQNLKENISLILQEKGFKNAEVNIDYIKDELGQIEIKLITLDMKNAVYIYDSKHIDIIDDIVLPVSKYLNIKKEQVNVIE